MKSKIIRVDFPEINEEYTANLAMDKMQGYLASVFPEINAQYTAGSPLRKSKVTRVDFPESNTWLPHLFITDRSNAVSLTYG